MVGPQTGQNNAATRNPAATASSVAPSATTGACCTIIATGGMMIGFSGSHAGALLHLSCPPKRESHDDKVAQSNGISIKFRLTDAFPEATPKCCADDERAGK